MRAGEFIDGQQHPFRSNIEHYINWVAEKLHLKHVPVIEFSNSEDLARSRHRTGYYNKKTNHIYVYTGHRNLVDIFRTIAHELTHEKQGEEGRLKDKTSPPGSPNEREADWKAGYLMKLYLKAHPDVIDGDMVESRIRPTGNDSPQAWIDYFQTSDHPNLKGHDPETLKRMALAARSKAVNNPPKPKPIFKPKPQNPNVRYWWQEKDEDIEEGWKDWVAGAGAAAMLAGGGGAAYDAYKANQAEKEPTAITAKAPSDFNKGVQKIAKDAVPKSLVTGSPHEKFLTQAAVTAGIKGEELAQFLGQCAHETMNFKHMGEIGGSLDFKKYDPVFKKDKKKRVILDPKTHKPKNFNPLAAKLGNTELGDGPKYHGRGYIQLTGKYNYEKAGKALGLDLVKHPELVEKPEVAAKVAVWFWQQRVQPKVSDFGDTKASTKPINPGLKHLDQRKEKFGQFTTAMR